LGCRSRRPSCRQIILLGDSAVGKSKILERYLLDDYKPRTRSTYALTLHRHVVDVDGRGVSVDFWDTAGQERFSSMHASYYHKAHGAILVFDVTRKVTYTNLSAWFEELRRYCPTIPVFVIANKIDVDYAVTSKAFGFPAKHGLPFHFVSAADGTNVVQIFDDAVRAAVAFKSSDTKDFMSEVMDLLDEGDALGKFGSAVPPPATSD